MYKNKCIVEVKKGSGQDSEEIASHKAILDKPESTSSHATTYHHHKRTLRMTFIKGMRKILQSGEWLSDLLAQEILQSQFPRFGGWKSTHLVQIHGFVPVQNDAFQIHLVSGNHWVTSVVLVKYFQCPLNATGTADVSVVKPRSIVLALELGQSRQQCQQCKNSAAQLPFMYVSSFYYFADS
ncbi:hypothetical protein EMCRGX_G023225 [Ephydatia muelleri]